MVDQRDGFFQSQLINGKVILDAARTLDFDSCRLGRVVQWLQVFQQRSFGHGTLKSSK